MELDAVVWAPVPYAPNKSDFLNADFVAPSGQQYFMNPTGGMVDMPSRFRHRLGTNKKGEDVLSGLIHASRISLTIGILSMGIATLIGLVLGALAGYFGDRKLVTTRGQFYTFIVGLVLAYYYGFLVRGDTLTDAIGTSGLALLMQLLFSIVIFVAVCYLFYWIGKAVGKLPILKADKFIPVDSFISRFIEILISPSFICKI